ncbi:MAG TPA: type II toxin-antitoxin system VapC family toxin [Myxococcales bacterium]|nr:type II toxin-antitoxin system VapC family toxin [Myxococcales bacterium]
MKALYLETSALAQAYLEDRPEVHAALHSARRGCRVYTSQLTEVEVRRALLHAQREGEVSAADAAKALGAVLRLLQHVDVMPLTHAVLARAGDAFPSPIRSLDAIHVATAVLVHQRREVEEMVMFSRDNRVRDNASALGMQLA